MEGYKRMLWTILVVGLWALVGSLATFQWNVFNMGSSEWKEVVVAVIAGFGMFATNYLAPFIKQYGIGST